MVGDCTQGGDYRWIGTRKFSGNRKGKRRVGSVYVSRRGSSIFFSLGDRWLCSLLSDGGEFLVF